MNIAIITSGILPFPPLRGGAVENLLKLYLDYNEKEMSFYEFTVFTVNDKLVTEAITDQYRRVSFRQINVSKWIRKFELYRDLILFKLFRLTIDNYYIRKVVSKIEKEEFDIIILENRPEFVLPVSKKSKGKIVLHLHNDTLNATTQDAWRILNSCEVIWCVSHFIKDKVETIQKSDKVKVLYNGIDTEKFTLKTSTLSLKKQFRFDDLDFVIVFSGRITKDKGIKELIEAFIQLKQEGDRRVKLLILGGAFYGTNQFRNTYFNHIVRYIDQYKNDIYFTGFIDYEEIPKYLSVADISIIPSKWDEPFGLTVIESLSIGLPTIVSDSGGIPEIVTSDCSIQIKRNSDFVTNIANGIKYLRDNPEVRFRMSTASRRRSLCFSKEKYCSDFDNLLKEIL